jgi:hypothetical protein
MKTLVAAILFPLAAHASVVTTLLDENDQVIGSGTGISLREAVKHSRPGDIITFAPTLSGQTIRLSLGAILISQSITIDASALASPIKLSGDKTGNGKTSDDSGVILLTGGSLILRSLVLSDAYLGGSSGCITINRSTAVELLVDGCTLSGNDGYHAAALYTRNTTTSDKITLQNSNITGNSVVKGSSAVSVFYCALSIRNCTFANNSTGAIFYRAFDDTTSQLSVENCTIVGNKATYGAGGIYIDDMTADASLKNVIFSGNTPIDISGGFSGSNILITAYPDLSPLGDYGGPTKTMPPNRLSSAIDRGATTSLTTDQRGLPRLGSPDIGAAEYQGDNRETALRWTFDQDGNGSPYGIEMALGTNPSLPDPANTRNFRGPVFNSSGHPVLSFGIGSSFQGTRWILRRSTDLLSFTEIYRYNGSTHTTARGMTYRVTYDRGIIIGVAVTDTEAPPAGAFYRFDAEYSP